MARTLSVAANLKLIAKKDLDCVIVDSTVKQKAIAYPTDRKLLKIAGLKLVDAGVAFKQTYAKEGQTLSFRASLYAHAKQYKRMKKAINRQSTFVGRLARHIERRINPLTAAVKAAFEAPLAKVQQIIKQSKDRKATKGQPKLYSWHSPEVSFVKEGKARQPYEFGCEVAIATTLKGNLVVGARSFSDNPFDGRTLHE